MPSKILNDIIETLSPFEHVEDNCCKKEQKHCQLSDVGNDCKALQFKISENNLAYSECVAFPRLLKKFICVVGLDRLRLIAREAVSGDVNGDGVTDNYAEIQYFNYKGLSYSIRLTITKSNGVVIFESDPKVTDVTTMENHATRMEIQRASETEWGAMRRLSNTTEKDTEYFSIWLSEVNLRDNTPADNLNVNNEVVNFRFGLELRADGSYKSSSVN